MLDNRDLDLYLLDFLPAKELFIYATLSQSTNEVIRISKYHMKTDYDRKELSIFQKICLSENIHLFRKAVQNLPAHSKNLYDSLEISCEMGNLEFVKLLLEKGVDISDFHINIILAKRHLHIFKIVVTTRCQARDMFQHLCAIGYTEFVQHLCDIGIDLDNLNLATKNIGEHGNFEIFKLLIDKWISCKNVDIDDMVRNRNLKIINPYLRPTQIEYIFMSICSNGHLKMAQYLVELGISLEHINMGLVNSISSNQLEVSTFLIEKIVEFNMNINWLPYDTIISLLQSTVNLNKIPAYIFLLKKFSVFSHIISQIVRIPNFDIKSIINEKKYY